MPEQVEWNPFDPDLFNQGADEAEKAFAAIAFGKLGIQMRYMLFAGKGERPTELSAADYRKADPKRRAQEVIFTVNASEFNPDQQFVYSRKVSMLSKDWRKTVAPSILEVFGEYKNLKPGLYVEVADVPQISDPQYNVPKFVRQFSDVKECALAWKEKFGKAAAATSSAIPPVVVQAARNLYQLVNNPETFKQICAKDPNYAQYPIDELMKVVA